MARDVYAKERLVKVIGMIMLAIGVCPVLGPLLGGYLQGWFDWRASFELLVVLGNFLSVFYYSYI
ncbi:MFS transporter [Piscirickettsia litoralis]|uniref:MFS transporter n=1 Tax=Piscirickettsia litoralis TaxID=1891921 RepID=UPI001F3638A1|nr:MFS transporter [Piscirickettsia litoralis]